MKIKTRKTALAAAAAVIAGMAMPVTVYAENSTKAVEIEPSKYLADNSGFLSVDVKDSREIRVKIEKNTPDGVFMYYNTLLDESGTYVFALDSCEYNIDTEEYDSDFTISIIDEKDTACSFVTAIEVADPGFSLHISDTQYYFIIHSNESAERSVSSDISPIDISDGIQSCTAEITMDYIPYDMGDVNSDGKIDLADAAKVLDYYAKKSSGMEVSFTDGTSLMSENAAFAAADITKDMNVGLNDAACILRYYAMVSAGMEVSWNDVL